MYGIEYLDWVAREEASRQLDKFLASFEPEDRKWILAVLRERFEVRVEYRDSLQDVLARQLAAQSRSFERQSHNPHPLSLVGSGGSVLSSLLGR